MKPMKLIVICYSPVFFFPFCINSVNILNNFQYISEGMIHFGVVEDTPTDHHQLQQVLPNPRTQSPTCCGSSYSLGYHNYNYLQVYWCPWSISHKHQNHCLSSASRHLHPHHPLQQWLRQQLAISHKQQKLHPSSLHTKCNPSSLQSIWVSVRQRQRNRKQLILYPLQGNCKCWSNN